MSCFCEFWKMTLWFDASDLLFLDMLNEEYYSLSISKYKYIWCGGFKWMILYRSDMFFWCSVYFCGRHRGSPHLFIIGKRMRPIWLSMTNLYWCSIINLVVKMWRCHGMVVWPLDSHTESPDSNPTGARYFCPSARCFWYPHWCSRSMCINGDRVGCERYCGWVGIVRACKMVTGQNAHQGVEKVHSECKLILNPMTGVIIHCEALWS